jgi:hypothetical protein
MRQRKLLVRIRNHVKFIEFKDVFNLKEILELPMTPPVWKRAGVPKYLTDSEIDNFFRHMINQIQPDASDFHHLHYLL